MTGKIERMIAAINASGATVCVVGLAGGRQEKFIMKHRDRMPGVRLWLPLGGTIRIERASWPSNSDRRACIRLSSWALSILALSTAATASPARMAREMNVKTMVFPKGLSQKRPR